MVWLWIQSENLTKADLYGFIMHAAHKFHEEVGYGLVYHGNIFMAEELKLEGLLDALIRGASMPRVVDRVPTLLEDLNLPPPKVPDSDDDALSFEDADAKSDHDVEACITGTGYDAFPLTV